MFDDHDAIADVDDEEGTRLVMVTVMVIMMVHDFECQLLNYK
jgi:hypothetical protein